MLPMYIEEHMKTERSIILLTEEGIESIRTFGLYALMDKIPVEELYQICELAAEKLQLFNKIFGRIGARPLVMTKDKRIDVPHNKRKDFLIFSPPENTVLEVLEEYGIGCYLVGKVSDMFRGRHITDSIQTRSNAESMDGILKYMNIIYKGVIWGNLNDFDAKYGHHFDKKGWNAGLKEFDIRLKELLANMKDDDLLVICSDGHGCDCTYTGAHTYEYSPLIVYSPLMESGSLGYNNKLNDLAATIADNFEIPYKCNGNTLL